MDDLKLQLIHTESSKDRARRWRLRFDNMNETIMDIIEKEVEGLLIEKDQEHEKCVKELEEDALTIANRENELWNENNKKLKRLTDALLEIKTTQGKVCQEFETCTHESCRSSYTSWAIADNTLMEVSNDQNDV